MLAHLQSIAASLDDRTSFHQVDNNNPLRKVALSLSLSLLSTTATTLFSELKLIAICVKYFDRESGQLLFFLYLFIYFVSFFISFSFQG